MPVVTATKIRPALLPAFALAAVAGGAILGVERRDVLAVRVLHLLAHPLELLLHRHHLAQHRVRVVLRMLRGRHVAEPTVTVLNGQHRNCIFLECDAGGVSQTTIECPDGTDFAISPKLRPGCCGAATFTIKKFGCPGQDESLQMWLRVDKPAADVCSDYNVQLHF